MKAKLWDLLQFKSPYWRNPRSKLLFNIGEYYSWSSRSNHLRKGVKNCFFVCDYFLNRHFFTPFLRTKSELYIFSDQALINEIFLLYIQMKRKLHERRLLTRAILIHYNVDFLLSPPIYLKWAVSCDKHLLIVDTYIWWGWLFFNIYRTCFLSSTLQNFPEQTFEEHVIN